MHDDISELILILQVTGRQNGVLNVETADYMRGLLEAIITESNGGIDSI